MIDPLFSEEGNRLTKEKAMDYRKQPARGKVGAMKPVSFSLVKALSGLRETNHRASEQKQRYLLTARDMVILGRLINSWKDVVGLQLAAKTCPTRLIRGKLYLTVADSQWMQTLVFLKVRIIEKLSELFPDMKINDVVGRPGVIPPEVEKLVREATWPDWQSEEALPLASVKDPELADQLSRCQRKLDARLRGLEERGYQLCLLCRAAVTRSKEGICAMCLYNNREDKLMHTRSVISEMPWLNLDEVREIDPDLGPIEFEAIRNCLLDDSLVLISELGADLAIDYDEQSFKRMKKEMVRAMMLFTGCMPDEVDFEHLRVEDMPDRQWIDFLAVKPGDGEC